MNRSVIARSLLLAGVLAAAGAVQAQTYWGGNGTGTISTYPDGTPVVVLGPNGVPYYAPQYSQYQHPGHVASNPGYGVSAPYGTPVQRAVVAPSPNYYVPPGYATHSTYPGYPAVISHAPQNPAVVMPRQIVPSTSGPVYYTR